MERDNSPKESLVSLVKVHEKDHISRQETLTHYPVTLAKVPTKFIEHKKSPKRKKFRKETFTVFSPTFTPSYSTG